MTDDDAYSQAVSQIRTPPLSVSCNFWLFDSAAVLVWTILGFRGGFMPCVSATSVGKQGGSTIIGQLRFGATASWR